MGIADIMPVANQRKKNEDLAIILHSLTKNGLTERITSLFPTQADWIFKLRVAHKVHFESIYNYVDTNVEDKEVKKIFNKNKQLIPDICELYMNLAVSEIEEKEDNLLGLIREIVKQDIINKNETDKTESVRM